MAYMSQEKKKSLVPGMRKVLDKYGMKGTFSVNHHSTLIATIRSGSININDPSYYNVDRFCDGFDPLTVETLEPNEYWLKEAYNGKLKDFLIELRDAMMIGNHNNSDIYTDYFDVGWYIDIRIGDYGKPYNYIPEQEAKAPRVSQINEITVREGTKPGYLEVLFPEKPEQSVIDELKEAGYRWSRFNKLWYGRESDLPDSLAEKQAA